MGWISRAQNNLYVFGLHRLLLMPSYQATTDYIITSMAGFILAIYGWISHNDQWIVQLAFSVLEIIADLAFINPPGVCALKILYTEQLE